MPIIAKETGSNFKPAPAGVWMAVCCDVVDLGMIKVAFPGQPDALKHKVKIVWSLADLDPEIGKRPTVQKRYTLSLHEKAALRKDLQSWRGKPFTPEERGGFDVEKVIGVSCMLNVVHDEKNGSTYANVSAIMPLPKGTAKVPPDPGYIREKDKPKEQQAGGGNGHGTGPHPETGFEAQDDDVPFNWLLPVLVPATAAAIMLGGLIA